MSLLGCVNLAQVHSSTIPEKNVQLCIDDSGPTQINIGGTIKGTSSGLVFGYNYLDIRKLSFNKVTMKLFVQGKILSGVRFKHVVVPLAKIAELRLGTQSLASLLPFIRKLHWLENPLEFGDDFKRHYTYDPHHAYYQRRGPDFSLNMKVRGDRGERAVVEPLIRRQMITDNEEWTPLTELEEEKRHGERTTLLMEDEEEEEDELMEEKSAILLTRLPNSITFWSLLTHLTLNKADIIGNAGCSIAQFSILKSLSLSNDYCRRIQPHLDVKLSFDIPPSALHDFAFYIRYNLDVKRQRSYIGTLWFNYYVDNYRPFYPYYDLVVEYEDWS
ncbi:uncharacterized protein LOC114714319 [Neltuma alba]|uniref:uncharacterized protein LOC114714319 n=1 Tax=Neltuma alba TaxID=207710 RepID=UPI0010A3EF16|nr:uncharacterized protein LOC114714319 [Prosopis alba]